MVEAGVGTGVGVATSAGVAVAASVGRLVGVAVAACEGLTDTGAALEPIELHAARSTERAAAAMPATRAPDRRYIASPLLGPMCMGRDHEKRGRAVV